MLLLNQRNKRNQRDQINSNGRRQRRSKIPRGFAGRWAFFSNLIERLAETDYVRKAVEERADLSAFRERPSVRILLGVFFIGFSYVVGWPAISALGVLAIYLKRPLLIAIGGPILYGLSHLVFLLGMYLSGAKYSRIFLRWATRVAAERWMNRGRRES